jgi:hypothetical protein
MQIPAQKDHTFCALFETSCMKIIPVETGSVLPFRTVVVCSLRQP